MKIIKRINTSAVLCSDNNGRQLVAFGRGIGYNAVIGTEIELSRIQRTFYNVDLRYISMLNEVDDVLLEAAAYLVDVSSGMLSYDLSPNLPFILADHISYAIKRTEQGIDINMPLSFDVRQQYPLEYKLGEYGVSYVNRITGSKLPLTEAVGIAMAFVNNRATDISGRDTTALFQSVLEDSVQVIEQNLCINVDREGFDFARYATHLQYLYERLRSGESINSSNVEMYQEIKEQYPQISACVDEICSVIQKRMGIMPSKEERLYLMMHVNRIAAKSR